MADGPPSYPSVGDIIGAADKVVDAAVKMRGEELRYIPQGKSIWDITDGRLPVDLPGMSGGIAKGPDGEFLGTDADWAALRDQYMWIVDLFAELCDPDPTQFQPLIDGMEQTALSIHDDPKQLAVSPVSQYVEDARGKIDQWEGEAAETFRVNFINKLELAAQNQAFVAGVMMHAMIAERDIFVKVRQDLLDLAKQTVNAIEAADNTDPGGIKTIFGVAAAITSFAAGVAAIPISGGLLMPAGIGAGLQIISGFSSAMGLPASSDNKGSPLSAGSVDGVLSKMTGALGQIQFYIAKNEGDVAASLNGWYNELTGPGRATHFLPPEPSLVHEPDSQLRNDFLPP
jgi:hypothetical protein